MTEVAVGDDFLDATIWERIHAETTSAEFPWYYNDKVIDGYGADQQEHLSNFQFCHNLYSDNGIQSDTFDMFVPLLGRLRAREIIRMKLNLTVHGQDNSQLAWHSDHKTGDAWTAVYYINDNNGGTMFHDGTMVENKPNRVVIFPSELVHCGVRATNAKQRIVVNVVYRK